MPGAMSSSVSPIMSVGIPQACSTFSMPRWSSARASARVFPCSRVTDSASSSACASRRALRRNSTRTRSTAGVARHAGKASRAARTARSTSSRFERGTYPSSSPVPGSVTGSFSLEVDAVQAPPMKLGIVSDPARVRSVTARAVSGSVRAGSACGMQYTICTHAPSRNLWMPPWARGFRSADGGCAPPSRAYLLFGHCIQMDDTPLRDDRGAKEMLRPMADRQWPQIKPLTCAGQVYEALRDRILEGELSPGEFIREQEVSEAMGVSRTPVREALGRLASEGFLERIPHRGFRIPEEPLREVLDVYPIVSALEVLCGRLALPRLEPADIERLKAINAKLAKGAEQKGRKRNRK